MPMVYLLAAVGIGAVFAAQPAINAVAAKGLGSAIPATVLSVAITLLASVAIMIVGRTTPTWEVATALPCWVVLGGLIGVLVVGGGTHSLLRRFR